MFKERLNLDERDSTIIKMLQKNPEISQEEIAKALKLSQPSVWARVRNLKQRGVIKNMVGINFKEVDLRLAKIDISSTDTQSIINEFLGCPYFLNALVTSGRYNLCLFFTGTDLKNIEGMVNYHLRGNPKVKEVEMNFVVSSAKDFVMPLNVDEKNKCKEECLVNI